MAKRPEFRVRWEIDIIADNEVEAARIASHLYFAPGEQHHQFEVFDLAEAEAKHPSPAPGAHVVDLEILDSTQEDHHHGT